MKLLLVWIITLLYIRILNRNIRLSQKLLSFYKEIIDAQHFLSYVFVLLNVVLSGKNEPYVIQ